MPILTASFQGTDSVIAKALVKAKAGYTSDTPKASSLKLWQETNMVKPGDSVVALHGQKEECPGHALSEDLQKSAESNGNKLHRGHTNLLKIAAAVADLTQILHISTPMIVRCCEMLWECSQVFFSTLHRWGGCSVKKELRAP